MFPREIKQYPNLSNVRPRALARVMRLAVIEIQILPLSANYYAARARQSVPPAPKKVHKM